MGGREAHSHRLEFGWFIAVGFNFATFLSSPFSSCILFAIVLGATYQAGILSASSRAEVAEQIEKIVPLLTCEIASGQVCDGSIMVFHVECGIPRQVSLLVENEIFND